MLNYILGLASLPILAITVSLLVTLMLFYAVLRPRIVALERRIALLNQQTIPISAAFQAILVQDLTHFHTPEMDALMVKLGPPFILTRVETDRLIALLSERERDLGPEVPQSERDAAHMLPLVIRRVAADRERSGLQAEPLVRVLIASHSEAGSRST